MIMLLFYSGEERYAISCDQIIEIVPQVTLKPVPHATGVTRLDWPTVAGRSYRLSGSTNVINWSTVLDWTRARCKVLSYSSSWTNRYLFYRVEVKP